MSDSILVNGPLPLAGGNVTVFQNGQPVTARYNGDGAGYSIGKKTYF